MSRRGPRVACFVALAFAAVACSEASDVSATVGDPVAPAQWDQTTPESAVRSYLDWVSFSYRMANSEIPTATMTPGELVRVDSYIQLNRMEDKGLEQTLDTLQVRNVTQEATSAVLIATEMWTYRYFSLSTLEYLTESLSASYDTTYTLVPGDAGWLVDRVEATPKSEVQ